MLPQKLYLSFEDIRGMYLGHSEILRKIKEEKLLINAIEDNIQGAGVDLRVDKLYRLFSEAYLGVKDRRLPEVEKIEEEPFTIEAGEYYLCMTIEEVNMPGDLIAFIYQRSTLFRSGITLRTAVVDPGYRGKLTIGMVNESRKNFVLERESRIAQIVFSELGGESKNYKGRYQGGKLV